MSVLSGDCLCRMETLMWAKNIGKCIVDVNSNGKSLFMYLCRSDLLIRFRAERGRQKSLSPPR